MGNENPKLTSMKRSIFLLLTALAIATIIALPAEARRRSRFGSSVTRVLMRSAHRNPAMTVVGVSVVGIAIAIYNMNDR